MRDSECDVLVIGSGAAGLAAALKAADEGLTVVVVEKEPYFGGTTAISAGWAWVPGTPKGGAGDTREEQLAYLRALAPDTFDAQRVEPFLDAVPEAISFFEERTAVQFDYPEKSPDYQMDLPGARLGGRAILPRDTDARILDEHRMTIQPYLSSYTVFGYMPQVGPDLYQFTHVNQSWRSFFYVGFKLLRTWWDTAWYRRPVKRTNGNALITLMVRSALDKGVTLWRSTPAVELLADDSGGIVGARLGGDHPGRITARRGVVIAAGGFSGDRELRTRYFPHDPHGDQHFTPTVGHGGDGARLAISAGGRVDADVSSVASWAPVTVFSFLRTGKERLFPHLRQIGLPGLICVDRHGRRFGNEALSYHDFGRQILDHHADERDIRAYLIVDSRAMHKYGIGYAKPWPMPRGYFYRTGYLVRGETAEELAAKLGIDPGGLADTLDSFNRDAAAGVDSAFGRGSTEYNHFRGDPDHRPNPNLAELSRPPYFGAEIRMGDLGTFAGIATDAENRVLAAGDAPVPGLYAVGAAAKSIFGGGYPGYGSHIGAALVNGYRVGAALAASVGAESGAQADA